MRRWLHLAVLLLVVQLSVFGAQAVTFHTETEGACKPGKTVALTVSMASPGDTAAFLVTAESDGLAFVRAEAGDAAKTGYTRAYGEGGWGSFVYTAQNGPAGSSGEVVRFVFAAPETPGEYTLQVSVTQVANADGTMTSAQYSETFSVLVGDKAPDTPAETPVPTKTPAPTAAPSPTASPTPTSSSEPGESAVSSSLESAPDSSAPAESTESGAESAASSGEESASSTGSTAENMAESQSVPESALESAPESSVSPAATETPLQPLPAEDRRSFWLGALGTGMVFALGLGVYTLLSKPKPPAEEDKKDK